MNEAARLGVSSLVCKSVHWMKIARRRRRVSSRTLAPNAGSQIGLRSSPSNRCRSGFVTSHLKYLTA